MEANHVSSQWGQEKYRRYLLEYHLRLCWVSYMSLKIYRWLGCALFGFEMELYILNTQWIYEIYQPHSCGGQYDCPSASEVILEDLGKISTKPPKTP